MSTLSISCFAILLKRSLQLHHDPLKRANGRLLPELERWLTVLGNDFEIPLSAEAARELRQGYEEKVSLQIILPPLSAGPQPTAVSLTVTGILVGNKPADSQLAIMPCVIRLDPIPGDRQVPRPSTPLQWQHILEHLTHPERLSAELVRPPAPPSFRPPKHRPVVRHYASINVRVSAPRVA